MKAVAGAETSWKATHCIHCLKTPAVGASSLVARERFMLRVVGTKDVTLFDELDDRHLVPVKKTLRTVERVERDPALALKKL